VAITLSTTFADNLLGTSGTAGVAEQIGGGTLVIYASGGSPPAGPNESSTGTVLATFTFNAAGSQGSPLGGSMTLSFNPADGGQTVVAGNTGTADYFRVINSGSVALIQGSVSATSGDWILSSTNITSGDNVTITGTATIAWTVS
jgi:hypothetical protein